MQIRHNAIVKKTLMRQNTNVTKCKRDKMQIRQNAKIPNINNQKPPSSRPPPHPKKNTYLN